MKTKDLFIAQFIAWAGFTVIDFIGEKTSIIYYIEKIISINLQDMCIGIPIMLGVLYFIRDKSLWNTEKRQSIKKQIIRIAKVIGIWFFITIVSSTIIIKLVCNDMWIVPQYGFSALAYPVFGFLLLVIPIGFVLVGELFILFFVKCSFHFHKQ